MSQVSRLANIVAMISQCQPPRCGRWGRVYSGLAEMFTAIQLVKKTVKTFSLKIQREMSKMGRIRNISSQVRESVKKEDGLNVEN